MASIIILCFQFIILFSLISTTLSQSPPYMAFTVNATELPPEDSFDYIIIGGGTAGCPLAATLSSNYRVLLLERGGVPHTNPSVMREEGFITTLRQVDSLYSPAEAFTSDEGVPNARGRVLGGSSAINAGFYSRADDEFYNRSGINWDRNLIERSYQWIENSIVFQPELQPWQLAVRDGLLESGIRPFNGYTLQHTLGTKIGGSTFNATGHRFSAADLLTDAVETNIKVAVYATVERILFTDSESYSTKNAIGVVFRDTAGRYHYATVRADGEVILAAGAIGSPHLLLLSGVGRRSYLSGWGIPVVYHSPLVGQLLYDNPRNGISFLSPTLLHHSLIQVVGITDSGAYLEASSNVRPYHSPLHSTHRRSHSSTVYFSVANIMEKIIGPLSAGSLRLASTEIATSPIVRFNYFNHPIDMQRCVNGTRKIGEMLRTRAMSGFRFWNRRNRAEFRFVGVRLPGNRSSDEEMGEFCRRTVNTIWHYHGGCLVGAVVDLDLKVMGVGSLRVIDGSVFSVSPGTNPQATVLMLGRHMGLKILRERLEKIVLD